MGAARKHPPARSSANSVTNEVLALTTLPARGTVGDGAAGLERYAVPAATGTAAALRIVAVDRG